MDIKTIINSSKGVLKDKFGRTVLGPLNDMVDENITSISTTIGSFVLRSIRSRWERSISFSIGSRYADAWMEEALYGILYKYNDIKKNSRLEMTNAAGTHDGSGMYYRLDVGNHNLKYRNYNILLVIQSNTSNAASGRVMKQMLYTIITYDLNPQFVLDFESDMLAFRNKLMQVKGDSPKVNVYYDLHEGDGYTYWEKGTSINKRPLSSIYLPFDQKKELIEAINSFFASRKMYIKHGIVHNLKILLYGPPGTGKDSIAKMIASEYKRNIYYVTGGKNGKFVPNAITSDDDDINYPLFIISDIDKYPFLINEPEVNLDDDGKNKEEMIQNKQAFGTMINALDGIMSGEGRIIIMTTNHIEKFSPVFMRPGRVDIKMEIGYPTIEVIRKYIYDVYGRTLPKGAKLKNKETSLADLQFDALFAKAPFETIVEKYIK